MAEDAATEEQESGQEEDPSTLDRLKAKVKNLTGGDSEEEDQQAEDSDAKGEGDSEEASAEGDSEEEGGEQEMGVESDEYVGEYKIDDADPTVETEEDDYARAQLRKLEKDGPPENLGDWPTGKAMYLTFGGAEGESGYEDGAASQLGPSSTRHHQDGSVEVKGEKVDNPEEYKGEKSVFEESDELSMDKGAKGDDSEDESGEDSGGEESGDDSAAQAGSEDEAQASESSESEGGGDENAEAEAEGSGEQAESDEGSEEQSETGASSHG